MNEFKTFHPIVGFVYFTFVISFSMILIHPVAIAVSFSCGFTYSVLTDTERNIKKHFMYMMPVMIIAAVVNPLFNHEGETIIAYFKNENPLTLESIAYGVAAAFMLMSVICHFSCFNRVITADKIMYLFGRIIPSLSLVISMSLRFVPRFTEQMRVINEAEMMLGKEKNKTLMNKLRSGIKVLSSVVTWALENATDTADSMRSRGYGERMRTSFSIYRFDKRDLLTLSVIILLGIWVVYAYIKKYMYFAYFPAFASDRGIYTIISFAVYFMLCSVPLFIELKEAAEWKNTK